METHRIKILRDTPFHIANTVISISDYRKQYPLIVNEFNSDTYLLNNLILHNPKLKDWFEVVEIPVNNFRVGDWVWHEKLKRAFCVVVHNINAEQMKPDYVTYEAANSFTEIYKRKATQEEINYDELLWFCDKKVLIGIRESYYYHNVWKKLFGITQAVTGYLEALKCIEQRMSVGYLIGDTINIEKEYALTLPGLKVGCMLIEHNEVIKIAKHLKLI